jgi:hypothetical protein
MSKIIPLISSGVAGPLGIIHLPRLWLKVSLEARGKLATGYPGIGMGYDMMVCNGLNLDAEALRRHITAERPSYPQFEAWVRKQPGVKLDKDTITQLNLSIVGYKHDDETRRSILAANGLPDDGSVSHGAVDLNNLDDWKEIWEAELKAD